MVSLCIMALVDEGRLSLDDRVRDLLPDIPLHGHGDALLVRHLLSHTGGLGEAPNPEDLTKPFETLFSPATRQKPPAPEQAHRQAPPRRANATMVSAPGEIVDGPKTPVTQVMGAASSGRWA
jgi:CubicO group peptidase (beta-lactamase class C family)